MIGFLFGDILGSKYELENHRSEFFDFFENNSFFTDETVILAATLSTFEKFSKDFELNQVSKDSIIYFKSFCLAYLDRRFSPMFYQWLVNDSISPYQSYGNAFLPRVLAYHYYILKTKLKYSDKFLSDLISFSHNHQDSINAGKCYFELLNNVTDKDILKKILAKYNIPIVKIESLKRNQEMDLRAISCLSFSCSVILESENINEFYQKAVSIGGDTDNICSIGASIAEKLWVIDDDKINFINTKFSQQNLFLLKIIKNYSSEKLSNSISLSL